MIKPPVKTKHGFVIANRMGMLFLKERIRVIVSRKQKGREKLKELEDLKRNLSAVDHHQVIGTGHHMYYHIIKVVFLHLVLSVMNG